MSILPNMIYDIRTTEYAQSTLTKLSGVPISTWLQYRVSESKYQYTDSFLADVIASHGSLPLSYKNLVFIYFHVTTSANGCSSIRKNGLLDLKQTYLSIDSELRVFLDQHDIKFNFDYRVMTHRDQGCYIASVLWDRKFDSAELLLC